jgi:hypothetical protein
VLKILQLKEIVYLIGCAQNCIDDLILNYILIKYIYIYISTSTFRWEDALFNCYLN